MSTQRPRRRALRLALATMLTAVTATVTPLPHLATPAQALDLFGIVQADGVTYFQLGTTCPDPISAVLEVEIVCPSDATAKINAILSARRGQILGFDTRPGWEGWDVVKAMVPQAEVSDLIVELRSATAGVGSYTYKFDHLSELTGKLAEQVLAKHADNKAA